MSNIELLASFIEFLGENTLIDLKVLRDDTDEGFTNRLKAQKYVYLAQEKFNLDLGYQFSRYKFGPYSSELTEDYYNTDIYRSEDQSAGVYQLMAETKHESFGVMTLPNDFNQENFLEVVSNKNESWLEVATTIINVSKTYSDTNLILDIVCKIKPLHDRSYIQQVFNDLTNFNLMDCQ
jgi:uncharacterized protein YwgA